MKRLLTLITVHCLLITVLSACALRVEPSTASLPVEIPLATPTAPATSTTAPSPVPSPTRAIPTPTETLLPPLDLPTPAPTEPARAVWDGQPTYLADSQPGFYFRIFYDPDVWALTTDSYGQPALGHRKIEYCILAPGDPRGLPPGMQVEHDTRTLGALTFEVNVVLSQGARQFVTYQATDKIIFTSFQVNFVDNIDACLADAEAVLATLTSIPKVLATPAP